MTSTRSIHAVWLRVTALLAGLALLPALYGSSVVPLDDSVALQQSEAVARGTVLTVQSWRDPATGRLWTDTLLRVDEGFKGTLPAVLRLRHAGGKVGGFGQFSDLSPRFVPGEERLVFLRRQADGSLFAPRGSEGAPTLRQCDGRAAPDGTLRLRKLRAARGNAAARGIDFRRTAADASTASFATASSDGATAAAATVAYNLILDDFGIPSRFPLPDRGEPIPYLVDADVLPAGMTQAQALQALSNALAAWTAVSSVRFRFEGLQSFGMAADNVIADDGRLRFQFHDAYNTITQDNVLGWGGFYWANGAPQFDTTGGIGGRVGAQEFHRNQCGYVVLNHRHGLMQSLSTFEEVLCHEIGHTLGLDHTSQAYPEPDFARAQSIMFWVVHADGRGATLGSFDPPFIQQVHPLTDTPPWAPRRVMRVVTAPTPSNDANVNAVSLAGFDLQTAPGGLTWTTSNAAENGPGSFAIVGNSLRFTPNTVSPDTSVDPVGIGALAEIWLRASDGVNASPWTPARVVSLYLDQFPAAASDGLPNSWMTTYWGNPNPAAGAGRGPNDDPDGDGLTNLQEFRLGTNPLDPASRLAVANFSLTPNQLTWTARPYELYQLERSTDLVTWTAWGAPIVPTTTTGTIDLPADTAQPKQFLRIRHVW